MVRAFDFDSRSLRSFYNYGPISIRGARTKMTPWGLLALLAVRCVMHDGWNGGESVLESDSDSDPEGRKSG